MSLKDAGNRKVLRSLFFLIVTFAVFLDGTLALAKSLLLFPTSKWDFGNINSSEKKEHTFSFKNRGKKKIKIISVTPSCGCTAAVVGTSEVKPGGEGNVKVVFDPAGLWGHHESTVLVKASYELEATLSVSADVQTLQGDHIDIVPLQPSIVVTPEAVDMGKIKEGVTLLYKVIVENRGEGDLYLTNLYDRNEAGVPLNRKPIGKGKKIEITFYYKANVKGEVKDEVIIGTNDPDRPEVKISLSGVVE